MRSLMEDRTPAQPTAPAGWWWGTNRPGGTLYAGRTHVVHPAAPTSGLCGLPVDDVWELRPPTPEHLCPDCCVLAMAASYPPFPPIPAPPAAPQGGEHRQTGPGSRGAGRADSLDTRHRRR